jgi:MFS family permease
MDGRDWRVATFFDALDSVSIGTVLAALSATYGLTSSQAGLLISAGFLGQAIGAIGQRTPRTAARLPGLTCRDRGIRTGLRTVLEQRQSGGLQIRSGLTGPNKSGLIM